MGLRSAELFLEALAYHSAAVCLYKSRTQAPLRSYSTTQRRQYCFFLRDNHKTQLDHQRMKSRRLLISPPLLPTITESLEDLPVHPSSTQSAQSSQSLDEYMTSIQALAGPTDALSYGPVRLQRCSRPRQFSKPQMKLSGSASAARGSPRSLRTCRLSGLTQTEDFPLRMSRERDCRGKDPVDWLFGQIRT